MNDKQLHDFLVERFRKNNIKDKVVVLKSCEILNISYPDKEVEKKFKSLKRCDIHLGLGYRTDEELASLYENGRFIFTTGVMQSEQKVYISFAAMNPNDALGAIVFDVKQYGTIMQGNKFVMTFDADGAEATIALPKGKYRLKEV